MKARIVGVVLLGMAFLAACSSQNEAISDQNTEDQASAETGKEDDAITQQKRQENQLLNKFIGIAEDTFPEKIQRSLNWKDRDCSETMMGTVLVPVLDENGMGTYLDGQDSTTCPYHLGNGISNTNRIRWDSENPDYAQLLIDSNNNAQKSAALGFAFDTSSVENELTQLDNVCSKYQIGLECGAIDPSSLDEFNAELKAAGIEKVIEEKQRQLNEFLGK